MFIHGPVRRVGGEHAPPHVYVNAHSAAWRAWVNRSIVGAIFVGLLPSACSSAERDSSARSASSVESIYTELSGGSCREEIDKSDPNATRYFVCPGVAGYTLIVRRAEAGRRSVDLIDAEKRVFPLNYQESVTPQMSTLRAKAEWRVELTAGKQRPIALIVAIEAHESVDSPDRVTHTYLAIAKIAPNEACVVAKILEGERSETAVRSLADSARARSCAPRQPR